MKKVIYLYFFGISLYTVSCEVGAGNNSNPSYSYQQPAREKTAQELREELRQKEQQEFINYLDVRATMRENFIGEKVIEGTLLSNSTVSNYKDVVLAITFFSKTGTELTTQSHVIYEALTPHSKVKFKIKTYAPNATEGFSVKIYSATPI
jgi:hypothetical protein